LFLSGVKGPNYICLAKGYGWISLGGHETLDGQNFIKIILEMLMGL
jgi:hypothetical protein